MINQVSKQVHNSPFYFLLLTRFFHAHAAQVIVLKFDSKPPEKVHPLQKNLLTLQYLLHPTSVKNLIKDYKKEKQKNSERALIRFRAREKLILDMFQQRHPDIIKPPHFKLTDFQTEPQARPFYYSKCNVLIMIRANLNQFSLDNFRITFSVLIIQK